MIYKTVVTICFSFLVFTPLASATLVEVNQYSDLSTSGVFDFGISEGLTKVECINTLRFARIRQDGEVEKVKFYIQNSSYISEMYIKIWRKDGVSYDLVGSSENIAGSIADGTNELLLDNAVVDCELGDYVGCLIISNDLSAHNFFIADDFGCTIGGLYSTTESATDTDYAWESQTYADDTGLQIYCYMDSLVFVCIGDSIMAGAIIGRTYISNYTDESLYDIGYWLNTYLVIVTLTKIWLFQVKR